MENRHHRHRAATCFAQTAATMIGGAALLLGLAASAHGQTITAEGDVYIDGNPAAGPQAVPLDVATVDVGSTNFSSNNNIPAQGRLTLDGGADLIVGELTVGDVEFKSFGLVEASGFGTSIDVNALRVGGAGDGLLNLRNGAAAVSNGSASFGSTEFANQPGRGDLLLQGPGSTLQVFSNADFNFGRGQVTDGGRLLIDGQANIGSDDSGYDLTLDTGGRFEATQFVFIGSSNFVNSAQSRIAIGVDSEFAADTAVIRNGGSIQLNGGKIRSNFITVAAGNMTGHGEVGGSISVLSGINETTSGRLSITAGRELNVRRSFPQSTALYNNGRIENDGTISIDDGLFENDFDGSYLGQNSTIRARLIENAGAIDLLQGFNRIDAELDNFSQANSDTPRVTVSGNATALFTGDVTNNGQIRVEAGSTATFTQNVSGSGTFDGHGQVVFLGGFTPGNSPGLVSFGGDLVLGSSLASEFEIGGAQRGTEYDAVDVAGELQLGGTLRTILTTGVSAGDVFTLFDAQGGVTGTFDNVEFEASLPSALSLEVIYTATQVQLGIIGPSLLGDYNGNGFVDAADYTIWQDNFNSTTNLAADGNGDGVINAADYTVWQDNFGDSLDSVGTLTTIPEPGTLGLTAAALALLLRRRRRQI